MITMFWRKYIWIIGSAFGFLYFLFLSPSLVFAQSCSGSGSTTYSNYACGFGSSGFYCQESGTVTNSGSCFLYDSGFGASCVFKETNEPHCWSDPIYGCRFSNQCLGKICYSPCGSTPTPTPTPAGGGPTATSTPTPTPLVGCTWGWVNGSCGAGGCASNTRLQTRWTNPPGCISPVTQCVSDPSCGGTVTPTPPPPPKVPNCSSVSASPASLLLGQSTTLSANYSSSQGNLAGEIFQGAPPTINSLKYLTLPGTSGSISYTWAPPAVGSYQVCCRAWNIPIAECRPNGYGTLNPPLYQCQGPQTCTTVSVSPNNLPSCIVSDTTSTITLNLGETLREPSFPNITRNNGVITAVSYSIPVNSFISICPDDGTSTPCAAGLFNVYDTSSTDGPFGFKITSYGVGSASLSVDATITGGSGATNSCSNINPITISVNNPVAWWQVIGGSAVSANGTIKSVIPSGTFCTGTCSPYLIIPSITSTVGAANIGAGSYNLGSGGVSQAPYGWIAVNSAYSGNTPSFTFFSDKVNSLGLSLSSINFNYDVSSFNSMAPNYQGYKIVMYDGTAFGGQPLNLNNAGNVSLTSGTKVLLLVKNAGVNIKGPITLTKGLSGLTLVSQGDISIDPTVFDLQGIYYTAGNLSTGISNNQLHVVGAVTVLGNVSFQRSLANNSIAPGEIFEYAPEQLLMFPPFISFKNVNWKEVAP